MLIVYLIVTTVRGLSIQERADPAADVADLFSVFADLGVEIAVVAVIAFFLGLYTYISLHISIHMP